VVQPMRRLSRARVITDIERIVKSSTVGLGKHKWQACGVECILDRHSYNGEMYGFDVEVLHLRLKDASRLKWRLYLITEFWRNEPGETVRMTKWLKQTAGKPADVMRWIVENREPAIREE
jgi:hypothetical protein